MYTFHWLERMDYDGEALVVHLAEMMRGEPDGLIGRPLEVRADSPRYRVRFPTVGALKTVPEPFNELSGGAEKIGPFLFQESGSPYALEMEDAMKLSMDIPSDALRHFVVYAENVVTHVLTVSAPEISPVT